MDAQVDAMLKEMVPLTGLEPVTPALRTQATSRKNLIFVNS